MRGRTLIGLLLLTAVLACAGLACKEQRDDASNAVSAAKAIMDLAAEGKKAEAAAKAAEAALKTGTEG